MNRMEIAMAAKIPVLPIALSAGLRASLALLALVTRWLKGLARARRHRRELRTLAGLERHMLADMGITRSDVSDAFSEPFWEDPTALLRERALERRIYRTRFSAPRESHPAAGFRRPRTDRPARQAV
jgi:uncharacterized protein YjiS (DUF1127 family)